MNDGMAIGGQTPPQPSIDARKVVAIVQIVAQLSTPRVYLYYV